MFSVSQRNEYVVEDIPQRRLVRTTFLAQQGGEKDDISREDGRFEIAAGEMKDVVIAPDCVQEASRIATAERQDLDGTTLGQASITEQVDSGSVPRGIEPLVQSDAQERQHDAHRFFACAVTCNASCKSRRTSRYANTSIFRAA
ncbi:hypothetical protein FH972_023055 [Carpinus fangiana]|uniref:Uncharacterized protein n=1 Tax=Carpinus fangiana TaxID=176857 RepID=A0A5N6KUJ8_9ROSI|nr:hypothetical protein FH972_023055 [Carpinus fangiana]